MLPFPGGSTCRPSVPSIAIRLFAFSRLFRISRTAQPRSSFKVARTLRCVSGCDPASSEAAVPDDRDIWINAFLWRDGLALKIKPIDDPLEQQHEFTQRHGIG